jgi:hypothetical protein
MPHRAVLTAAFVLLAAGMAGCKPAAPAAPAGPAAAAAPTPTATSAATLGVQNPPALGEGFAAMPRFNGGEASAVAKINAAMAKLDATNKEGLTSCTDMPHNGQSQEVSVPLNGPDLLQVDARYESDCGAYPSSGTNAYVFDLKTGELVDWSKLIPGAAIRSGEPDHDFYTNTFSSKALQARVVAAAKTQTDADFLRDCVPVLQESELSFTAAINTETHTLDVTPDLAHAVQACGDSLKLGADELRALNADPRLIAALE